MGDRHYLNYLILGLSAALSLTPALVNAQLIPDNTLGKENSVVNSLNSLQKQIDGGAIRGSNLFHSFKEFNIDSGKSVYFSNPTAIQNILARVTGKNPSSIFGKLGVLGNANLFLLNPNGIIFGKDGSLDISGSFTATTSPNILLNNGFEFSATNPNSVPLLKVNITPGLQYSRSQQGDITNQGNLSVGKDLNFSGKNLNLTGELNSGGDLNLQASDTLQVRDNSTNPFIASAGGDLLLQANQTIDIFALNHPGSGLFSGNDLVLQSSNPVLGDARYFSGGSFRIEQLDGNLGDLSSPNDPIIRANGDVSFDSYTGASLHILAEGSVNITGDVTITGADGENGLEETVTLSNGESLEIDGKNQATLDIRAGTTAFGTPGVTETQKQPIITSSEETVVNPSGEMITTNIEIILQPLPDIFIPEIPNTKETGSSSNIVIGGNIRVNSADGLVFLTNQYKSNASLSSGSIQIKENIDTSSTSGNGGKIVIDSSSDISNLGLLNSSADIGNGGRIIINSSGDFTARGDINTSSNTGKGGNITIQSDGLVIFDNVFVRSNTKGNENLASGDIDINASSLEVTNGTLLLTSTFGIGDAGDININATDLVKFDEQSRGFSGIESTAEGNGGNISITTASLEVTNGGLLSASTRGIGNAGNVIINATELVKFDGESEDGFKSGAFSGVEPQGEGNAGGISITTGFLEVTNGGLLSASAFGLRNTGSITINAASEVKFDGKGNNGNPSGAFSQVYSQANSNAGNIFITTELFELIPADVNVGNPVTLPTIDNGNPDIQIKFNAPLINSGNGNPDIQPTFIAPSSNVGNPPASASINATSDVEFPYPLGSAFSLTNSGVEENASGLFITADSVEVTNGALLAASTNGKGDAGKVIINARNLIKFDGKSGAFSGVESQGKGNAGGVFITTQSLEVTNGAQLSTTTRGIGNAGSIIINARNLVKFDGELNEFSSGAFSGLESKAKGNAGGISITTDSLEVTNGAQLSTNTKGIGNAGIININANNLVKFDGESTKGFNSSALSRVSPGGNGNAGGLSIITDLLEVSNGAELSATTFGKGDAGSVTINATSNVKFDGIGKDENPSGAFSQVKSEEESNAGDVFITTNLLKVSNGAELSASTNGKGNAGSVKIAADNILLDNGVVKSNVGETGEGKAGGIDISTSFLKATNDAELNANTNGKGDAGSVKINANETIFFDNSKILSDVGETGKGKGGNININTAFLSLINGTEVIANTNGEGDAGSVIINVDDSIQINANSNMASSATGNGNAGNLLINTNDINLSQNAKISATTESGIGGNISLENLNYLNLNNSEISASTIDGVAGNLNIKAAESIELTGKGGLSVQSTSDGIAGSITVNTSQFSINDNAQVSVSSPSGQGGNLNITADNLFLTQGILTAETGIGDGSEGANIILDIKDLFWIQNDSLISAEAFDTANGGNITINNSQGFVIGLKYENSDITANATLGNGGNIDITTQNIFGLIFREEKTSYSDITASSQFGVSGRITINQLNVNPATELLELPSTLQGAGKIKAGCAATNGNKFIVSGKGGLPQSPDDLFNEKTTLTDLFDLVPTEQTASNYYDDKHNSSLIVENQKNKIVEATGWVVDDEGSVVFVAKMPENNSQNSTVYSVDCESFSAMNTTHN